VSIWYGCVLRADLNTIMVGAFTNIQDRTIIHAARWDSPPLSLGLMCKGIHQRSAATTRSMLSTERV